MADKTISQLTPASVLNDQDLLVLEQGGTAKKMAGTVLKTYISGVGGIDHITLNADYTLTVYYTNGTSWTSGSIRGATGAAGADGEDGEDGNGIASAVLNANYTLTLTFTDGTSYTTPSIRGAQGETGADGDDGFSPTATVSKSGSVATITITDKNGTTTAQVNDGTTPDVSGKEDKSNKVTSMSSASTDTQYPSAKCVYDLVGNIESALAALR